jgi:hypothetical protein
MGSKSRPAQPSSPFRPSPGLLPPAAQLAQFIQPPSDWPISCAAACSDDGSPRHHLLRPDAFDRAKEVFPQKKSLLNPNQIQTWFESNSATS